jgi:hypothetical protein
MQPHHLLIVLLAATLSFPRAASAQDLPQGTADLPPFIFKPLQTIYHPQIWYFAWYATALGDINGDGYDDFAVASLGDTTFIFLGGDTLQHDPAWIVRGGSAGVVAADFNRNGKMDIATAIADRPTGEETEDRRGAVRIYLQKDGPVPFAWEPDLLIQGGPWERIGEPITQDRGGIFTLDYNGDGWPDLLTRANDERDSARLKAVIYLGGPELFGESYDVEFRVLEPKWWNHPYVEDIMIGDLNGDGCDDVFLWGRLPDPVDYWDLYLGNPEARADAPDHVLREDVGWAPQFPSVANIVDIDGDGYDDIIDGGKYSVRREFGHVPVFRSWAALPQVILPNDSIPNYNPFPMGDLGPGRAFPVGDMNGDGVEDLMMSWATYFYPHVVADPTFYFYPGGPNFHEPLGVFATRSDAVYVRDKLVPVGDVNGDGFDDIIQLGKATTHGKRSRFILWGGARQLRTSLVPPPTPASADLTLSPNPLPRGTALRIEAHGLRPGRVEVRITDLLGRMHRELSTDTQTHDFIHSFDTGTLPPGVYLLSLRQGEEVRTQGFVVLDGM